MAALDVRRQALRGFGLGVLLAAVVFAFFVAVPGSIRSPIFYVGLGFVLAVSTGLLATVGFVLVAAYRLVRESEPVDRGDLPR